MNTKLFITCLLTASMAMAQSNMRLDVSFNQAGHKKLDIAAGIDFGNAIALQKDGKIVVAGSADTNSRRYTAFARLNTSGDFDTTFSKTGRRRIDVGTNLSEIWDIAVEANGKIVAVGSVNNNAQSLVMRLNSTSSIDGGFAKSGKHIANVVNSNTEVLYGVALQPDGKIVACGYSGVNNIGNMLLKRFTTTGIPDSTFNNDGIALTDFGKVSHFGFKIAVQPDGKIVVAGQAGADILVARYQSNGKQDLTFGSGGSVIYNAGYTEQAFGMTLQPDGKIVVVGRSFNKQFPSSIIIRLNTNGSFDTTFANKGVLDFSFGKNSESIAVEMLSNGKLVVCSIVEINNIKRVLLSLINKDGTLDYAFSKQDGSFFATMFTTGEQLRDMVLLPGDKIAVVGFCEGVQYDMFTAVYLMDATAGVLDFNNQMNTMLIYPNPIQDRFHLDFELEEKSNLSFYVTDLQGRRVAAFEESATYEAGKHKVDFQIQDGLPAGNYWMQIQGEQGIKSIQIKVGL